METTDAQASAAGGRIASLDGLRGVAAFVVLVHHCLLAIPTLATSAYGGTPASRTTAWVLTSTPLHLFWAGHEAVFVFFVLSGLVLTLPVLRRGIRWRSYHPARLIRLYGPVVAAVALATVVAVLVSRDGAGSRGSWLDEHAQHYRVIDFLANATLVAPNALNSVLWSLRWEVVFSLALPAYVLVARWTRRLWWVTAALAVAMSTAAAALEIDALTFLPVFLLGSSLAAGWEALPRSGTVGGGVALALCCLGITATWWLGPVLPDADVVALPVVLASAALLVVVAGRWGPAQQLLERPLLRWLGSISFSLYLVHEPVVVSVALLLPPELAWMTFPISAPLSLGLAVLFARWVEFPMHRLAKRVGRAAATRR